MIFYFHNLVMFFFVVGIYFCSKIGHTRVTRVLSVKEFGKFVVWSEEFVYYFEK